MMRDQFDAALDRYGGDLARWPLPLRQEAEALIASDAGAGAELDRARRLECLLAEVVAAQPVDSALVGRIVSRRGASHAETVLKPTWRLIGWASAAMAATLLIGFVVGATVPADESSDAIATLFFTGADEDIGGGLL